MTPDQRSRPLLETEKLTRVFGSLEAVDNVTFSVRAGERRALIGPNGAGKTTFFNLLTGQLEPTSGSVYFKGEEITRWSPRYRSRFGIGRTYQVSQIFPELSVRENLRLAVPGKTGEGYSIATYFQSDAEMNRKINTTLDRFSLADVREQPAGELSHGQKRQLEIALGWAGEPEVLLMDEPTAGLSPDGRDRMVELIESLPDSLTLVLIEHDMDMALDLADRVTCLHAGSILAEDTPENIQTNQRVREVYLGTDRTEE